MVPIHEFMQLVNFNKNYCSFQAEYLPVISTVTGIRGQAKLNNQTFYYILIKPLSNISLDEEPSKISNSPDSVIHCFLSG